MKEVSWVSQNKLYPVKEQLLLSLIPVPDSFEFILRSAPPRLCVLAASAGEAVWLLLFRELYSDEARILDFYTTKKHVRMSQDEASLGFIKKSLREWRGGSATNPIALLQRTHSPHLHGPSQP